MTERKDLILSAILLQPLDLKSNLDLFFENLLHLTLSTKSLRYISNQVIISHTYGMFHNFLNLSGVEYEYQFNLIRFNLNLFGLALS